MPADQCANPGHIDRDWADRTLPRLLAEVSVPAGTCAASPVSSTWQAEDFDVGLGLPFVGGREEGGIFNPKGKRGVTFCFGAGAI